MALILTYKQLQDYFADDKSIEKLIDHLTPYISNIETISQMLRKGEIDNPEKYEKYSNQIAGIYSYLSKISAAAYTHANLKYSQALLEYTDNYYKNAPLKQGSMPDDEKKKYLDFSSTVARAYAEDQSAVYKKVAGYIKAYIDSMEKLSMSLGSNKKQYTKFGKSFDRQEQEVEEEPENE